jgi:polyisoprenoid-binding protein YceI
VAIYEVDAGQSRVVTRARSSIHDTTTRWGKVTGTIDVDPDRIESARARFEVDMTDFDAGDFLKNRKLKKDLATAEHPLARFELSAVEDVERRPDGSFAARGRGHLSWRGREVEVVAAGSGQIGPDRLEATARFELDVTALGVTPPRFFVFKVEDIVAVEVTLAARAGE